MYSVQRDVNLLNTAVQQRFMFTQPTSDGGYYVFIMSRCPGVCPDVMCQH